MVPSLLRVQELPRDAEPLGPGDLSLSTAKQCVATHSAEDWVMDHGGVLF